MTPRILLTSACAVAVAITLAGCGITNPYQTTKTATPTARNTTAARTSTAADGGDPAPERGGTIPAADEHVQQHVAPGAGAPSARTAVLRYARLYINWSAATLSSDQHQLARISVDAARLTAEQQATAITTDRTLRVDHLANHGQVISAAPGIGVDRGRWVIVTREQTLGTGSYHDLPYELHITLATTVHTAQGWVISQWSPQL